LTVADRKKICASHSLTVVAQKKIAAPVVVARKNIRAHHSVTVVARKTFVAKTSLLSRARQQAVNVADVILISATWY
jgi:hypothetical protein